MKIEDYLKLLRGTPLPSILVIGGIAFLLLSVLQRAGTSIETKPGKERFAVFTGIVLLLGGIALYLVPPTQPPVAPTAIVLQGTTPPAAQPTDTPKAIATNRVPPPTSTPTVQPIATATPVPPSGCGGWCEEIGQIPESGTRISRDLAAGQLMFSSGG